MRIHPGGFKLVLAGPKVSRVLPFLQARGFVGDAFASGQQAAAFLRTSPCHVLIVEIELGDMMGVDLAKQAKDQGTAGAVLLLEDPVKPGMIISALVRGVDAFVPTPPDEAVFLGRLESLLLAQWGLAMTGQQQALNDEVVRLRTQVLSEQQAAQEAEQQLSGIRKSMQRDLAEERKKVTELVREIASLRDQLNTMHLLTGAKTGASDEGKATVSDEGAPQAEMDDFDAPTVAVDLRAPGVSADAPTKQMQKPPTPPNLDDFDFENEATPAGGAAPSIPAGQSFANNDEDTAPGGHQVPSQLQSQQQKPKKKSAQTANLDREMLKDLAGLPSANEEEVLFVDDD